jgi:arabinofuranan 3-O-arabinosyltransferase
MADITDTAGARSSWPPLRCGLPIVCLCLIALAYAWVAIPLALIPIRDLSVYSGGPAGNDFLAFYSAGLLAWRGRAADVYDLAKLFVAQDAISGTATHLPFPYPPHFLLYAAPLATMPYLPALYAWIGATSTPFVLLTRKASGLAAPLVALAPPLIQNAIDGQNGALTASLFAGGLLSLGSGRPILAGVLLTLLTYKPQVFVLIPICLLAAREYRALGAMVVTGVALLLASVAAFGVEIWRPFLDILPQQMAFILDGHLPVARCPTIFVLVWRATGSAVAAEIGQGVSTLAAWLLVARAWRRNEAIFPRALAFCVALPLSTPYMLEYDLAVWALPASILMVRLWRGEGVLADWLAFPLLWLGPTTIWLMGVAKLPYAALLVLPLVPYALRTLRPPLSDPLARRTF